MTSIRTLEQIEKHIKFANKRIPLNTTSLSFLTFSPLICRFLPGLSCFPFPFCVHLSEWLAACLCHHQTSHQHFPLQMTNMHDMGIHGRHRCSHGIVDVGCCLLSAAICCHRLNDSIVDCELHFTIYLKNVFICYCAHPPYAFLPLPKGHWCILFLSCLSRSLLALPQQFPALCGRGEKCDITIKKAQRHIAQRRGNMSVFPLRFLQKGCFSFQCMWLLLWTGIPFYHCECRWKWAAYWLPISQRCYYSPGLGNVQCALGSMHCISLWKKVQQWCNEQNPAGVENERRSPTPATANDNDARWMECLKCLHKYDVGKPSTKDIFALNLDLYT